MAETEQQVACLLTRMRHGGHMLPALIRSEQRNIPQVVRPVNHQPPTGNSRHQLCITSGDATHVAKVRATFADGDFLNEIVDS